MKDLQGFIEKYYKEKELVELTRKLIQIPSHVKHPGREREVGLFLGEYLKERGLEVTMDEVTEGRVNVIAVLRGSGGGKNLLLNGHLDTVPPGDMDFDPYEGALVDGFIQGRGAVDMKGPIASMVTMMLALKNSGLKLQGDVIFTGVIGEEEKSEGTEKIVKDGIAADGAIVGEPSSYQYSAGHRGLEWLEIEISGKAAHGGMPHLGINAIEKAAAFIERVKKELYPKIQQRSHPLMGQSVMNFGHINGGIQPSTVAGKCIIQIDRRYIPGETPDSVIQEYQEIIDQLHREDDTFEASIKRMENNMQTLDHLPLATDLEDPITKSLTKALGTVLGKEPVLSTKRGWTDASLLYNFGNIPTIVYGPGDISYSHTKNEQVAVKELKEAVEVYFLTAVDFCGVEK